MHPQTPNVFCRPMAARMNDGAWKIIHNSIDRDWSARQIEHALAQVLQNEDAIYDWQDAIGR